MNIETNDLINRLREEENLRHDKNRQDEEDRHNNELQLISNLHERISNWEATLKTSVPANGHEPEPEPEPKQKRRGRPPGRKPGRKPAVVVAPVLKERSAPGGRGYAPMREKIAVAAGVNVAAEGRRWIAQNKFPFTMDQIVAGVVRNGVTINEATIRSRLFPFLAYLSEHGQVVITGEKRNHVYTPTESFDPVPKRGGASAVLPPSSVPPSEKEKLWQELRSKMPSATKTDD